MRQRLDCLSETGSAGSRKAYVAAGLVHSIDPNRANRTLFYARIRDFIEFDRPVPYRDPNGRFLVRMLGQLDDPATAGRPLRGRSVRAIDHPDFGAIVNRSLVDTYHPSMRSGSSSIHGVSTPPPQHCGLAA